MTDPLFPTPATQLLEESGALEPGLYRTAKIVGCFHPRILSRSVGVVPAGTPVKAVFHRRASDGWWSVDILKEDEPAKSLLADKEAYLTLIQRSPWVESREGAERWLRYRSRKA